jgi:hypothetical protein
VPLHTEGYCLREQAPVDEVQRKPTFHHLTPALSYEEREKYTSPLLSGEG